MLLRIENELSINNKNQQLSLNKVKQMILNILNKISINIKNQQITQIMNQTKQMI